MLAVQTYLQTKTFEDLTAELGIVVKKHDTLPLAILNYDQIESPKTHPIVRECRGLVLHAESKDLVARSFPRFFNWGEVADEMGLFDFSDFIVESKEDGSMVVIYNFEGKWHANTRGSFATDKIATGVDLTWREAFCEALDLNDLQELNSLEVGLDTNLTYVCEFCSPYNKIVRRYEKPVMFLLTAFEGLRELTPTEICERCSPYNLFLWPTRYHFYSIEEIQKFLDEQAAADPTFEGVVIRDKNGQRWKIKSATYLGLHKLRGEGDNLYNPKNLLPFILSGEDSELLTYYPEVTETFMRLKSQVQNDYATMLEVWMENKDLESQKDFALAIKGKTDYTSVLFNVRKKYGAAAKGEEIRREWRDAENVILKKLKGE